jgi:hypothetical protein
MKDEARLNQDLLDKGYKVELDHSTLEAVVYKNDEKIKVLTSIEIDRYKDKNNLSYQDAFYQLIEKK